MGNRECCGTTIPKCLCLAKDDEKSEAPTLKPEWRDRVAAASTNDMRNSTNS